MNNATVMCLEAVAVDSNIRHTLYMAIYCAIMLSLRVHVLLRVSCVNNKQQLVNDKRCSLFMADRS
jgi:hypothetical protein